MNRCAGRPGAFIKKDHKFSQRFGHSVETPIKFRTEAPDETAEAELREALTDISRRPSPDVSGAVHHAMAALECVAREYFKDSKSTLGELISKHRSKWPKPLDEALEKAWGFASNNARHGREDRELLFEEAQLIVGLAATMSNYFCQKMPTV